MPKLATRSIWVIAIPVSLAGLVAGAAPAALAATARAGSAAPAAHGPISGRSGVVASSDTALIEHWNGSTWKRVPSPSPGGTGYFQGVAATSATNAWAVGSDPPRALIEHWNGTAWTQQKPSSGFPFASELDAVAAISATNAWAVGFTGSHTTSTLIEHWNGTTWTRVPSPAGKAGTLLGVAATSATNAWAVGCKNNCAGSKPPTPLMVHWNGKTWSEVSTPGPPESYLYDVAATSATNAWAVGYNTGTSIGGDVILHWNGTAWKQVPAPSSGVYLKGVAATSTSNAWAVGDNLEQWNGTTWTEVLNSTISNGGFEGVAATSAKNAWAVGNGQGSPPVNFAGIMHWNGTAWKQVPCPTYSELYGVAATSATNAWAVGFA
jgi:hypothetical protein